MEKREPIKVIILTIITFGIYGLVWVVKTKEEMNKKGCSIPTALWLIVPFLNLYWIWLYAEGVEKETKEKFSQALAFLVIFLTGPIGLGIIQDSFNKISGGKK